MSARYPRQNPRVAWRVYDGEAALVSPDDSTLHTLNAVGTVIWEAADGKTPVDDVVARVCDTFAVLRARAERDVAAFIDELCARGLMTVDTSPVSD